MLSSHFRINWWFKSQTFWFTWHSEALVHSRNASTKQKRQSQKRSSLNNEFLQGSFHVLVPQAVNEGVHHLRNNSVHH